MTQLRIVTGERCGDDELAAAIDMFTTVADALGIDAGECAAILHVPEEAFPLRSGPPTLTAWQERRLRHVIDIGTALGLLVGDADQIAEWMRTLRPSRDGETPLHEMIRDETALGAIRRQLVDECRRRFGPAGWNVG